MKKVTFLAILFIVLLPAACRGGGPSGETRPTPIRPTPINDLASAEGGGAEEAGGGQAIALRLWVQAGDPHEATYRALADAYAAANPGVTLAVETFDPATYATTAADALAAGNAADLLQLAGGAVCPLAAHLSPAPADANPQAAFDPALIAGFTCDGALYGLPRASLAPWGLVVSANSAAAGVAWDFARFAAGE